VLGALLEHFILFSFIGKKSTMPDTDCTETRDVKQSTVSADNQICFTCALLIQTKTLTQMKPVFMSNLANIQSNRVCYRTSDPLLAALSPFKKKRYCFGLARINARCPPKPLYHCSSSAGQGRGKIVKGSRVEIRTGRDHSPITVTGKTD